MKAERNRRLVSVLLWLVMLLALAPAALAAPAIWRSLPAPFPTAA